MVWPLTGFSRSFASIHQRRHVLRTNGVRCRHVYASLWVCLCVWILFVCPLRLQQFRIYFRRANRSKRERDDVYTTLFKPCEYNTSIHPSIHPSDRPPTLCEWTNEKKTLKSHAVSFIFHLRCATFSFTLSFVNAPPPVSRLSGRVRLFSSFFFCFVKKAIFFYRLSCDLPEKWCRIDWCENETTTKMKWEKNAFITSDDGDIKHQ